MSVVVRGFEWTFGKAPMKGFGFGGTGPRVSYFVEGYVTHVEPSMGIW